MGCRSADATARPQGITVRKAESEGSRRSGSGDATGVSEVVFELSGGADGAGLYLLRAGAVLRC